MNNFHILPLNKNHSKEIYKLQEKNLRDFGPNIWRTEELEDSKEELPSPKPEESEDDSTTIFQG